jgi:hypothetical protein
MFVTFNTYCQRNCQIRWFPSSRRTLRAPNIFIYMKDKFKRLAITKGRNIRTDPRRHERTRIQSKPCDSISLRTWLIKGPGNYSRIMKRTLSHYRDSLPAKDESRLCGPSVVTRTAPAPFPELTRGSVGRASLRACLAPFLVLGEIVTKGFGNWVRNYGDLSSWCGMTPGLYGRRRWLILGQGTLVYLSAGVENISVIHTGYDIWRALISILIRPATKSVWK